MAEKAKFKVAYHIKKEEGREKPFFNRIGVAFVNKNGSLNLHLEYLPLPVIIDGKIEPMVINIQDYVPREKKEGESFSE
jgi:hypothetical protein